MARLSRWIILSVLQAALLLGQAAEFKLTDGTTIRGEAADMNLDGMVVRLDVGGYSPRISWTRLSQESLKQLADNPQAKPFVEPFIEFPAEELALERAKKREITIRPVAGRLEPMDKSADFWSGMLSPVGVAMLGLIFLANLYAAYEVAFYRNRSPALVCALSAVLPILGPLIFLAMPPATDAVEETAPTDHAPTEPAAPAVSGGPLSVAAPSHAPGGVSPLLGQVFTRGDTTFNRRFFETKFPGFFRMVPNESEKDLVLAVKTPRGEIVAKRIARITMNEMFVLSPKGSGTVEVPISFGEVSEVRVRHKDG